MNRPADSHPSLHVVVGAGPVGSGLASKLAERGDKVIVLTRSGTGPTAPGISLQRGDARDPEVLARVAEGAASLVNAVNPPYTKWATEWPVLQRGFLSAAERTGTRLVMMDNLYGYGHPSHPGGVMRDGDPLVPCSKKGTVRADMAEAMFELHRKGSLRATSAMASDFFGAGVTDAQIGERSMSRLLAGRPVDLLGDPDAPHTITYMPDVVSLLAVLATDDRALGRSWHVPSEPARTMRALYELLADRCAAPAPRFRLLRGAGFAVLSRVVPILRELAEVRYQFDAPFVMDSTDAQATFGLRPTPFDEAIAATASYWRTRLARS